jgi:hypothetical protein
MPHADLRGPDGKHVERIATIQAAAAGVPADIALLGLRTNTDTLVCGYFRHHVATDIQGEHPALAAACLNPMPDRYFGVELHDEDATIFLRGLLRRPLRTEAAFNEQHTDRYSRHLAAAELIPSTLIRSKYPHTVHRQTPEGQVCVEPTCPDYHCDRTQRHTILGRAGQALQGAISGLVEEGVKLMASHGAMVLAKAAIPALALHPVVAVGGLVAAGISTVISLLESEHPVETLARTAGQMAFYSTGNAAPLVHASYNALAGVAGFPEYQLSVLGSRHVTSLQQDAVCLAHLPIPETQPEFKIQHGIGDCYPTFGTQATLAFEPVVQTTYRKCKHNNMLAVASRIGLAHPGVKTPEALASVTEAWKKTASAARNVAARVETHHAMRFEAWLKRFPGPVKRIMRTLRALGGPMPWRARYKLFLKLEKSAWLIGGGGKETVPRVISACLKELTYWTGRHLLPLAKACHRGWKKQKGGNIFYASGQTPEQIGDAFRDAIQNVTVLPGDRLVFIEDDQNRFDLHLTKPAFDTLDAFYEAVKLPRHIRRMLKRKISRGRMQDGTKLSVPYTMQSGNPDTGLGDSIINAIMKTYIHHESGNWSTIICGDDSVTVTTLSALNELGGAAGIRAAYLELGMEATVEVRTHPLSVEFCSGRFQPSGSSYILVPKTGKMLTRAFWDIVPRRPAGQLAWSRGVALGLLSFGRHNPFYATLGRRVLSLCGAGPVIRTDDPYSIFAPGLADHAKPLRPFDPEGFAVYHAYHYGYTSKETDALIEGLSNVNLFTFNKLPLVKRAARVDLCARG